MHDILLSALQHYVVCPRQCALIHMEQIWTENEHTAAGRLLHESVHSGETRLRDGVRIVTDLELHSARLGLRGKSDAVELHRDGRRWRPYPVEYKKGSPHGDCLADSIQLCGQALCLEEMFAHVHPRRGPVLRHASPAYGGAVQPGASGKNGADRRGRAGDAGKRPAALRTKKRRLFFLLACGLLHARFAACCFRLSGQTV